MAFGLNRVELIGRLGADVTVNHLTSGGRVANLSVATDESYLNKQTGERVDKTEWHRIVTFQDGLITMFEKHAGRAGWSTSTASSRRGAGRSPARTATGSRPRFSSSPAAGCSSSTSRTARTGTARQPATEPANGPAMPAGGASASADDFDDDIPF